jgi:murein L,D-transpeptidase YafK
MNPHSSFHLAFNLGYPNAFDTAHERTGSYLMVHGDCSSRGCYALTDAQIAEVYTLAREAFAAGQRAFQVQAFPFRMTPKNMARHRGNPNMPFWRNLKEGYDHFEVARSIPRVDVCERRYVFNAQGEGAPPFDPAGRCPAYQVPEPLAHAVAAKQQSDDQQMAELVRAGIEVAPIRTNTDGGMHPVFAKLKPQPQPGAAEGADEVTTHSIPQGAILRESAR